MCLLHKINHSRRGFTIVEAVISLAIMSLLSIITVMGMIVHARMAQANLTRQEMSENTRRFLESANVEALDSTIIRVDTGPAGAGTVLTLGRPDPANLSNTIYREYAYLDNDNNPATLRGNRIVERITNTPNPMATNGKVLVRYCAPVGTIFSMDTQSVKPLANISFRVGDQSYPQSNADDAVTGKGYQSFLVSTSVSKL